MGVICVEANTTHLYRRDHAWGHDNVSPLTGREYILFAPRLTMVTHSYRF